MSNNTMSPTSLVVLLLILTEVSSIRIPSSNSTFVTKYEALEKIGSVIEGNWSCVQPQWKHLPRHVIQYSNCEVKVLRCYCLTQNNISAVISSHVNFVVGRCLEGCFFLKDEIYHRISLKSSWNNTLCAQFNRVGALCGRCKSGYGYPVYSFSLRCVQCHNVTVLNQILLYIAVAYGPLTIFLVVIVVFTVSVNSAPLHGWIFVCQFFAASIYMRVLTCLAEKKKIDEYSYRFGGTVYGIWNLDFFRSVYKPFCLHPRLTPLQVMSLDFIIAAYPLIVIVVIYVFVDLYSHNYRPVVIMCRPFHYCCTRFRNQLDIKTSLIDAFGTFFSLSYVKMFSTTVDLMIPTLVWSDDNTTSYHSYSDGTQPYFRGQHIPLAVMSVALLIVFNMLPLLLLLLYSFPKTQICISWFPRSLQNALYPFMDNILSCYKDGTNGTPNCRYFVVVYHVARMLIWSSFMWTESILFYSVAAVIVIVCGMLVTLIRPYKSAVYNSLDTFLLLSLALGLVGNGIFFVSETTALLEHM